MESHIRRDREGGCGNQDQNLISTGIAAFTNVPSAGAMMGGGAAMGGPANQGAPQLKTLAPSFIAVADEEDDD